MKKFYCCDYCDELFETEDACKAHEKDCADKADFEESRALDKESIVRQLKDLLEEVEIFDEAYNADILKELTGEVLTLADDCNCDCDHGGNCDEYDYDDDDDDDNNAESKFDWHKLNEEIKRSIDEEKKDFINDVKNSGKDCSFYLNGEKLSKENFLKEFYSTLDEEVVPAAKAAAKTAVKKTDDFLTTILDKLDKLD